MREHERNMVDRARREVLKAGGGVGLLGLFAMLGLMPGPARAMVGKDAFAATALDDALAALGAHTPEDSPFINLNVPDVAENATVVPVTVETILKDAQQIFILVDKNPTMLVASFAIPEGTEAYVTTRIKMAQTSSVIALVQAKGKFYKAAKEVKVTQGGC